MRKMKYWVLGLAMSVSLLVGACGQAPATGTSAAVKETTEAVTESVTVEAVQTPKAAAAQTGNSGAFDLSAILIRDSRMLQLITMFPSFPTQI